MKLASSICNKTTNNETFKSRANGFRSDFAVVSGLIFVALASQLYRQAISLNDQHADAHRSLAGLLIETNREKFAFDLMNEWKNRFPNSTEPVVELARLYQEYGDDRRATDLLADALKLDPNNIRALKGLGHIREIQGQSHLALDNYLRVLQLDKTQTDVAARVAGLQSSLAALPIPNGLPLKSPDQEELKSLGCFVNDPTSSDIAYIDPPNAGFI